MFILSCWNKLKITTYYAHKCTKCRKMALWSHEKQETLTLLTDSFLTVPFLAGKSCNSTTPILFNTHVIKSLSVLRGILAFLFLFLCNSLQPSRGNRAQPIKVPAWHELKPFKWRRMSWSQNERELKIERWRKAEVREGQLFSVCRRYPFKQKD